MNIPEKIFRTFFLLAVIAFGGLCVFAQGAADPSETSYEATLYVVLGSDDATQRGTLPKSLEQVSRQIRENFAFGSYRLMNVYYGRLANGGSLDYKSVSSLQNASSEIDSPSFLDWKLTDFRADTGRPGRTPLSMQAFRFGARVPITIARLTPEGGKSAPVTNYESVGLNLNKMSLPENSPTLIGTISLPRTTGTVFLVMAIRPV